MKWIEFLIPAGALLLTGGLYSVLPSLRKRGLYFGVTVTEEYRDGAEGRAVARGFRLTVWGGVGLSLVALWLALQAGAVAAGAFSPLLSVVVGLLAWVRAWRAVRPHALAGQGVREVVLGEEEPESLPGGAFTAVAPYLMVGGALAWLVSKYEQLPTSYPVHWGASGQADRYVEKSYGVVVAPALIGMAVLTLVLVNALLILRAAKRGSGGESTDFAARHRRGNVQLLAVTLWMLALIFVFVTLLPLLPVLTGGGMLLVVLAPVAVILVMALRLYGMSAAPTGGSDGMPEECWKLGMIYYNPADPALLVEKRSGPGFTLNFGHRLCWLLVAGLAGAILLPMFLAR